MKVISLNTWGGRGGKEALLDFFKRHTDVEVFCLQEIWEGGEEMLGVQAGGSPLVGIVTHLLSEIRGVLPNHSVHFRPHFKDYYGLAMFIRNDLSIESEGDIFVYKDRGWIFEEEQGNHARNLQYATIGTSTGIRTILNVHGLWNGGGKKDCEERLIQSDNIAAFTKNLASPFVLLGDFNLEPDTESVARLEAAGMRNLIKEYGVTSTRTSFYEKPVRYADYAFVSGDIEVRDFKVLPDEVSDHSPLYLDFA